MLWNLSPYFFESICREPFTCLWFASRNGRLVEDRKKRVVFTSACATVEHCCCAPHDLKPVTQSLDDDDSSGSNDDGGRSRHPGGRVVALAEGAASAASGAAAAAVGAIVGRFPLGHVFAGEAGLPRADCGPSGFDNYLSHTELDPQSPSLGTILRKVGAALN